MIYYTDLDCRMINASILSYEFTENGPLDPSLPYYDGVGFDPKYPAPHGIIRGYEKINAAFVGRTTDNNLIVAVRGTIPPFDGNPLRWINDWINDFKIGQTPWNVPGRLNYGLVEQGFADAARDLWYEIRQQVIAFYKAGTPPSSIVVTGHSKGAAVAPLIATLIRALYPHQSIQVITFAQPLVGNQAFKDAYTAEGLNATSKRFQYQFDIVPFLPEYPVFTHLHSAAQVSGDTDFARMIEDALPLTQWAYVDLGSLHFIDEFCNVLTGRVGYDVALAAIAYALAKDRSAIPKAHSAKGGYQHCVCPPHEPPS